MFAKTVIFVLCAQALLIQSALSQVCGRSAFASGLGSYGLIGSASPFALNSASLRNSLPCNGLTANSLAIDSAVIPAIEITPTSGGGLPVTSASPTAPNSLIVASENVYEGTLEVGGDLPFIGTVGLEGLLPSAGTGAVNHACGNGATRMVSQDGATIASGFGSAAGIASGSVFNGIGALGNTAAAPFRFGSGLTGLGYPTKDFGSCNSGFNAYPGVNNAFGFGAYGNSVGSPYGGAIAPAAAYGAIGSGAAYGGAGEGNVAVAGELPVAGNAAVAGQVPIMGAVRFGGDVPAAGAVAITGNCACGCGSPYVY